MTRIKICGVTNADDAWLAAELGADAIGLVFADSPRRIEPLQARAIVAALPPFVTPVGVFVNTPRDTLLRAVAESGVRAVQLHGDETPDALADLPVPAVKAFRVRSAADLEPIAQYGRTAAVLLDARVDGQFGGTGQTFDWALAREAQRFGKPVIVSGGLTPENVGAAIRAARPFAVDVSSGVEITPRRKDPGKLRAFFAAVRAADAG